MRKQLRIAELVLGIESDGQLWDFELDSPHRLFEVGWGEEGVSVRVHWHPLDQSDLGEELFSITNASPQLPPSCRLYRDAQGFWNIEAHDARHVAFSRRVAIFHPDLSRGDVYVELRRPGSGDPSQAQLPYPHNPFGPPLDRVLFAHLLAQRSGMLLHAGGVIYGGGGYLFAGRSGAGKTTLTRLWSEFGDVTVLGEECLALRTRGAESWVYGTPWIGESRFFSVLGAPLRGIYFLRHARENALTPLPMERAMERLLARSFLPTYDPVAAHRGLDFCVGLVRETPAYEFGFRPDASAVQFIRAMEQCGRAA